MAEFFYWLTISSLKLQTPQKVRGGGFEDFEDDDVIEDGENEDKDAEAQATYFYLRVGCIVRTSSTSSTTYTYSQTNSNSFFNVYWYDENGSSQNWGASPTKNGTSTVSSSTNNATNCATFSYQYDNTGVLGIGSVKRMGKVTPASSVTSGYVVVGAGTSNSFANTSYQYSTTQSFSRWHYSSSWVTSQPSSSSVTNSTSTTPLYVYVRKQYSVAFLYRSGSGGAYTYSVGAGLTTTAPTASAPTGYTFAGWSSSWDKGDRINNEYYNGDSVSVEKNGSITVDSDLTYYAVYTPNTYEITLDSTYYSYSSSSATSGSSVTSSGTTAIYEKYATGYYTSSDCTTELSSITLPTYTGYSFGGYYTEKAGTGTLIIASDGTLTSNATNTYFSSNTTLYAKWEKLYYLTVRYYRQYVAEATSYASFETTLQVTQSSCIVTDNYNTTTDGIIGCGATCTTSTAYYASVAHTYYTASLTVTITKQHSYGNYYMNATTSTSTVPTTSSSENSVTYSWTPTSNATIYVNVYQKTYSQIMYYQQNVTNTTGITVSSSGGVLSGSSLSSTSTTSFIYVYDIYSITTRTITISRQNTSYNYNVNLNSTSGVNSNSYTWTPNTIVSVTVNVFQRYTITYNGNGYTSGTVPSTQYKIHGISATLASNSLTKTNYSANGWNTATAYKATPDYTSSSTYSTNANLTLYANFVPNTCDVTIKLMTVTETGTTSNSTTGGTVSLKSTIYDTSSSTLVTTQTVSITSASATQTVQKNQKMTFTPTTTSGYVFCGVSSSSSVPTNRVAINSWTPTSATTLYVYFKQLSNNLLKHDSTNDYYYFEDGYMPQTYAEMISSGLNATITSNGTLVGTYTLENGTTYKLSSYDEYYYLGFKAPKAMSLTLESYTTSGAYSFTKGTWYWFRFEPIRWRVSSDDWYYNGYLGMYDTNYTVVSDLVLWYDCMDTNENHKEGDKAYDMSFTSSLRSGNFNTMLSAFASGKFLYSGSSSVEYQKFGEVGQANPVQVDKNYSSSLRVASTDEISDTIGNTKAKASCLVAFLMGSSNNQYSKYWTRDLGNNLNAGKVVAQNGLTRSEWLSNSNGIRFAYTMFEGSRGNL